MCNTWTDTVVQGSLLVFGVSVGLLALAWFSDLIQWIQ